MVFKKVGFKRVKPTLNKKIAIAKATTKKDIAQDKIIKRLAKTIGKVERKYFDGGTGSLQSVVRTPLVFNLSNIAQGNDISNRVGDQITPTMLDVAFTFRIEQNSGLVDNSARIVIVQDKEQNGVDPTFSGADDSIFEIPVAGVTETLVPKLKTNLKQFKILYDRVINLGNISSGTTVSYALGTPTRTIRKKIKLGGIIYYDATAGADASNKENNIFLLVISSQNTADVLHFSYYSRLHYTDL